MCSGDFRRSAAPLSSASSLSLLQKAKKKSRKRREKQLSILYFTQEKKTALPTAPFSFVYSARRTTLLGLYWVL